MAGFWKKKQFWGALIGVVLLGYCVKDIRLEDLEQLAHRVNPLYLVVALLTGFVFVVLKGIRWRGIVAVQKKVPWVRAVTLYSVGQLLGIVMPALTGQVGRILLFARQEGFLWFWKCSSTRSA